uniref:Uncharacterized protein n=1 Tax=Euplotes harpa TaxID=151035 RepID=A0A7S3JAG7_9SPIT
MNALQTAKQETEKETLDYVFNRLIDKSTGTVTMASLKYALYSNNIPNPKDEKVFDEMMQYLREASEEPEEGEGEGEDEVDYDHFERIFKSFKFKLNADGNIL